MFGCHSKPSVEIINLCSGAYRCLCVGALPAVVLFCTLVATPVLADSAKSTDVIDAADDANVTDDSDDSEGAVLIVGTTDKPRWELGIGAGFFSGYDYPASNKSNQRAIAVPFFIYRSPALRLGDGG